MNHVPFLDLAAQSAEIADEVLPVWRRQLATGGFIGGPEVAAFEAEYADYLGVPHVVGVSNGTDALELAFRASGVGPGDEVIMPANTFIATAEAVSRIGAVPVFVDVDADHLLIDPQCVDAAITARTRALVPVHLFGQTAPLEALVPIADKHGLTIVEDAAQAQGASGPAGRAGAIAPVSATSFYPGKNLGAAGDAGAVMTRDPEVSSLVRNLGAHGSSVKYSHDHVGMNARLDAIQATVLRAKLRRLEGWNEARRVDVWHLYVVQVERRDQVITALTDAGIGTGIHYPTPVPLTKAYAPLGYRPGQFPVAERAAARILSLPMFPHLSAEQQERTAEALAAAVST